MTLDRFSPLPELGLRNRVVVPPMASGTADEDGRVTAATRAHYRDLARSGAGLLFLEYTYVHPTGRSEPNQLGLDDDAKIPALAALRRELAATGLRVGIQLTHCGGKGSRALAGGELLGPSAVPVPTLQGDLERPRALLPAEVHTLRRWFVEAAGRAARAGFDMVELHAAHGYGLNQWLSPLTNRRRDSYGGSLANRARLLLEIVDGIRVRHPRLAVAVRVPGQDLLEGGLTIGEMRVVSRWLEARGVALLDVSSGMGGWRRPRDRRGQGYLVEEATALRPAVSIPVIGVGGITEGAWIDGALRRGDLDLAAVGRGILEDPAGFRSRVLDRGPVRAAA